MGPVIASVSLGAERLFRLKGKNGAVAFADGCPMEACSSWRETPSKTSSMRYQKNLMLPYRGLT